MPKFTTSALWGGEHRGLDNETNMLVLCPNCHAKFDALAMAINPRTGQIACFDSQNTKADRKLMFQGEHMLAAENIDYHWRRFREVGRLANSDSSTQYGKCFC